MIQLTNRVESEFLPFVNKPGRYTGNEYNVVIKNTREIEVRVALAFPEIYELGMSYMGYDILYHVLNSQPHLWAERVYAPWFDAEEVLRNRNIPLFSLESRTPLKEFDWIGFTLQYELTYTNILNMLDLAGIPLRSADRAGNDPLIIGGGPSVFNPEPVADFFDAFLVGDGEEAILEICEVFRQAKKANWDRLTILKSLAKIAGVYIPAFYQVRQNQFGEFQSLDPKIPEAPQNIRKRILPELSEKNYPLQPLVPVIEVTHDRLPAEIMRGCTEGCRFCNAGMIYRPVRQRPAEEILDQTRKAIRATGFNEVSLLSLNSSDYRDLSWLMAKEKILSSEENLKFSFPSLRLDGLTAEMVDFVQTFKKTGFTFAPEAGSQRLRNVINKNIRDEDLLKTLQLVLENGWQMIKFYFMIGLPTEKEDDLLAMIELIKNCNQIARSYKNVKINLSISPFSPKPHTPFQWEKQNTPEELQAKITLLQKNIIADNINLSWRDGYTTSLETSLVRGGREMAGVIEGAWKMGARFDGWDEGFNWARWTSAFENSGVNWKDYLKPISVSQPLPWDHIDMGITKTFLQKEKIRAYEGQVSPDCRDQVCLGCGLQRKEFEDLVDCYQKDQVKKNEVRKKVTGKTEGSEASINYGRGVRRKSLPVQQVKKKIRLQYTKLGLSRFFSHLDVVRIFDRGARRAKISLVYSQGYTPRPKLSFGPPLGVGIASLAEYLDVEAEIGSMTDFQQKLNNALPAGMQILAQKTIFTKVPSLSSSINRVVYETDLDGQQISEEWIEEWLDRNEINYERTIKEETKTIDLRPYVRNLSLQDSRLICEMDSIEGRMARINEVLESLLQPHQIDYRIFLTQRTAQYIIKDGEKKTPLEVV